MVSTSVSVLMPEGDDKDQMQVAESAGEFTEVQHQSVLRIDCLGWGRGLLMLGPNHDDLSVVSSHDIAAAEELSLPIWRLSDHGGITVVPV